MEHQVITVLDTHPVLLNTLEPNYNLGRDWPDGVREMRHILDIHPEPLFIVDDIRAVKLSLDDLIVAASLVGRGETPLHRHPNALGTYFISDSKTVEMAAAGLNSPVFDNMKAKVFHTVEEALADIEGVIAH